MEPHAQVDRITLAEVTEKQQPELALSNKLSQAFPTQIHSCTSNIAWMQCPCCPSWDLLSINS